MQDLATIRRIGPIELVEELFGANADGLMVFDRALRIVHWNAAMEAITGIDRGRALGKCAPDLFPRLTEPEGAAQIDAVLAGQSLLASDRAFMQEPLRSETCEVILSPLRDEQGASVGAVVVLRDRGANSGVHQQLRETERRFRAMADCAPVLLWMSGTDALCDFFNQAWLDFTGRPMEQEAGVGWAEGVHPEDLQPCLDLYMASFSRRQPFEMIYRLRRSDGEYRWILDRGAPRYTPDGNFAGFIGSCIDITDRKASEDALRKYAADLAHMNSELEKFVHLASHDLQEPLRMVTNFSELLGKRLVDGMDPNARDYIKYVIEGARRMKDQIDGFITYAALRERTSACLVPTDCNSVVTDALAALQPLLDRTGAKVIASPLPTLRGDPPYLSLLFQELIDNAIKFRSEETPSIAIDASRSGATWHFTVRDNGMGFDMKHAERMFVIFQRLNRREDYPGSGIGLAIAKRIVEYHGGTIRAESFQEGGCLISLTLPVMPSEGS